jgi:hypothetical protein
MPFQNLCHNVMRARKTIFPYIFNWLTKMGAYIAGQARSICVLLCKNNLVEEDSVFSGKKN